MPRCNAGGGRNNQNNNDPTVPRRSLFSNFGGSKGGKGSEKGKRDGGKDDKGKGRRPVFESQKEMDKWKGKGKGGGTSQASTAKPQDAEEAQVELLWQKTNPPSYLHATFCLTRDDHLALEPLLGRSGKKPGETQGLRLPTDVVSEASQQLKLLGFPQQRVKASLDVVGPELAEEADEKDADVTVRAAAERALEWLCSVLEETEIPAKLREPREVAQARKRQEDRNVAFQTKALMLGGDIDPSDIARIEKLGFPRPKAIEAIAKAPGNALLPAVKALLAEFLPLEEGECDGAVPSTMEELLDEVEALRGVYGDESVQTFKPKGSFELAIEVGSDWQLAVLIPAGLPYPCTAPILCPRHARLRDASRPKLLSALGEVCRSTLGTPMLLTLCEWLREDGETFLVQSGNADNPGNEAEAKRPLTAVERSLEASAAQRQKDADAEAAKSSRVEYLLALQSQEHGSSASKPKDKIAAEIREDPTSGKQFDLSGYEDDDVHRLVQEAFGQPIDGEKMVRITFITGGGKTVRNKYSETLPRALGAALQDLGYAQDATAALTWESGGTFKGQHDKERNLKLVHVFPKMISTVAPAGQEREESPQERRSRLVRSSWSEFVDEVAPWVSRKDMATDVQEMLEFLEKQHTELQEISGLLVAGRAISDRQRQLYDELGGPEEVSERAKWLASEVASKPLCRGGRTHGTVDGGKTFSFQAPSELAEAARASAAGATGEASGGDGDFAWLRRRLQQTRAESESLRKRMSEEKPLTAVRRSLPAWGIREQIQSAVRENSVIVIEGDTGCGKSTQVPQFIFEDWAARGEGGAVNILMTQPRRLSAIGVADRVATEMDCRLGDLVGYSIRLESKKSQRTKVLVCTTGVVLRRLEADRLLQGVTHIIVDECHERDLDTDFLLTVLRDVLPKRPALKVLLMSATVNAQVFCDYFGGCPSVHIPGRTFPVTSYYLEHALAHTNFVVEQDGEYSRRDAEPMSGQEVQELRQLYERQDYMDMLQCKLSTSTIESLNRMDPEKINFDLVAAVVHHIHTRLDPVKGREACCGSILVFVPGLAEIKKCIRVITELAPGGSDASRLWVLPLHSMISVSEQRRVFERAPPGHRKVVVTTNIAETSITIDDVEYVIDCGRHKQTRYDPQNRITMLVNCMETKANAKQRRGRAGRVKAGICYHLVNLRKWKRLEDFERPEIQRVPLDSLCLRISLLGLGHPAKFLARAPTPPSDSAVQASLKQLVELSAVELQQKRLGDESSTTEGGFGGDWTKEEQEKLMRAKLRLTPLGTHLAQLPVDACIGKLLVLGSLFGIPHDVCTLAAGLSSRSPFSAAVSNKRQDSDKRRLELANGVESDQLLLVTLYDRWDKLSTSAARSFCRSNGLDMQTLEAVKEMRNHLLATLTEQGFVTAAADSASSEVSGMPSCLSSIVTATEEFGRRKQQLLRALLCGALWPNIALRKSDKLFARQQASLTFHPSSILYLQEQEAAEAKAGDWNCPSCGFFNFGSRDECKACGEGRPAPSGDRKAQSVRYTSFMFGEKTQQAPQPGQRPKIMVRDCSGVTTKAILFFGHHVHIEFLSGRACVDGWIHCMAAPRDGAMLLGLRRRLQEVLMRRLQGMSSSSKGKALDVEDREVVNAVASVLVLDAD